MHPNPAFKWRADEADWLSEMTRTLTPEEVVELQTENVPTNLVADIEQALLRGPGFALIRGVPIDAESSRCESMLLRFGSELGIPVSQSVCGDRVGRVEDHSLEEPEARGYRNHGTMSLHTDVCDLVALLCIRPSTVGGTTLIASAAAILAEVSRRDSAAATALRRGFAFHRLGLECPGSSPVTEWDVPVVMDSPYGLQCRYVRQCFEFAARLTGRPMPATLVRGMDLFDQIGADPRFRLRVALGCGDLLLLHNFRVLHGREEFLAADPRLLLRLWLDRRPRLCLPEQDIYRNPDGSSGIAPRHPSS